MKYILLLATALTCYSLLGCASHEEPKTTIVEPAALQLLLPPSATPEDFWQGVEAQVLLWRANSAWGVQEIPLAAGAGAAVDFSQGGHLELEGRSAGGAVLVHGAAEVEAWDPQRGQAKLIVISLQRSSYN